VINDAAKSSEVSVIATLNATAELVVVRLCEFTLRKVASHLMRLLRAC
jgi:hypothetical protein